MYWLNQEEIFIFVLPFEREEDPSGKCNNSFKTFIEGDNGIVNFSEESWRTFECMARERPIVGRLLC